MPLLKTLPAHFNSHHSVNNLSDINLSYPIPKFLIIKINHVKHDFKMQVLLTQRVYCTSPTTVLPLECEFQLNMSKISGNQDAR